MPLRTGVPAIERATHANQRSSRLGQGGRRSAVSWKLLRYCRLHPAASYNRRLPLSDDAQSFSVKRAQVEFHNFASLGEPERAIAGYLDENQRRSAVINA